MERPKMVSISAAENAAISRTVQRYIDGIANTDVDLLISAFHPDATMTGFFDGEYSTTPRAGEAIGAFMRTMPPTSEHSPHFKGRIAFIVQHGTLANVAIDEDKLQGKDMKTFFILHKFGDDWLIASKGTWVPDD
jgi:ketosteroid isomerase-like protein